MLFLAACAQKAQDGAVLLTPVPALMEASASPSPVPVSVSTPTPEPVQQLRYIFLFIGDGMGPEQVASTNRALEAAGQPTLTFSGFPVSGMAHTHSASSDVTDSAAASTALATGVKTGNGMLGLSPDGAELTSLAAQLHEEGRAVGLCVTCALDDATPAGFYAQRSSRKDYDGITDDLLLCGFDFLSGGGLHSGRDLSGGADGFSVRFGMPEDAADAPEGPLLLLCDRSRADDGMAYAIDGGARTGLLARTLRLGIDRLSQGSSFFIMIEGSKIDLTCHYHDAGAMYAEILDFDAAVKEALAFYEAHPNETLILVTADHETGGLTFGAGDPAALSGQQVSADAFSAGSVAAWRSAQTPFDEALPLIQEAFGLTELTPDELAYLEEAYAHTLKGDLSKAALTKRYGQKIYPAVTLAAANLVLARAGLSFSTTGHTGTDVPVYAIGLGSALFAGSYENTAIHDLLTSLIGQYPLQ